MPFADDNMDVVEENKKVPAASAVTKNSYSGEVSVNILQDTLAWGHLCPTSPGKLISAGILLQFFIVEKTSLAVESRNPSRVLIWLRTICLPFCVVLTLFLQTHCRVTLSKTPTLSSFRRVTCLTYSLQATRYVL